MMSGHEWAKSPYSVETMGLEMFQQARWLAVYGAYIAALAQHKFASGCGAPTQSDVNRYSEEAVALANMMAVANGDPER
jgi:hypothetical protein